MYSIVKVLNDEGVDAPGVYVAKHNQDVNLLARYKERSCVWTVTAVARTLDNGTYIGNSVYNCFESASVASRRSKRLSKEEWQCVEGCHQAIVSKREFERVCR